MNVRFSPPAAPDSNPLAMRLAGRPGESMTPNDLDELKHLNYQTRPLQGLASYSSPRP
jgi:hypothetical protein